MRGGIIDHDKVLAFQDLVNLLGLLNVIDEDLASFIVFNDTSFNPLIFTNKIFLKVEF